MQLDPGNVLEREDQPSQNPLAPLDESPPHALGHATAQQERTRDRQAFKVLGLARSVLGHEGDGRVEPSQARDPGADEGRQENRVGRRAEAEAEGCEGGSDAEGDLWGG